MKKLFQSDVISTGLAIFSMFFGAGNLMFPIAVGLHAGDKNAWGMLGFLITAVLLPLIGLITISLFDGDYDAYFKRVGKIPGELIIVLCMLIIGPMIAMPRIATLSHIMIAPFLGNISLPLFSGIFLVLTFLGTFKESKIVNLLGFVISPLLLVSLFIIIGKGMLIHNGVTPTSASALSVFKDNLQFGYNTLDLLGSIFFSSIVILILRKNFVRNNAGDENQNALHKLAMMALKAGLIGTGLLAIVYVGMSYLGVYHGAGLEQTNPGELFSAISLRVLGHNASIIVALAVLMACYSTIIALAAVVAEYVKNVIFQGKLSYMACLTLVLITTFITGNLGLSKILHIAQPIIAIGYPVLIVITLFNLAYKLFGFEPIKLPVAVTFGASLFKFFN